MALKEDLSDYHDLVAKSLAALDRDVAQVEDRHSNLAATQGSLSREFEKLRERELAMKDEVLALNKSVSSLVLKVDGISRLVGESTQDISRIDKMIERVNRHVELLAQWHKATEPELSSLATEANAQKGHYNALVARVSSVEDAQRRRVALPRRLAVVAYLALLISTMVLGAFAYIQLGGG